MSDIQITIVDPAQSSKSLVEIADDVVLWQLMKFIVDAFELPKFQGAQRIQYHLGLRSPNGRLLRLLPDRTLAENKVKSLDVLQILVETKSVTNEIGDLPENEKYISENVFQANQDPDSTLVHLSVFNPETNKMVRQIQYIASNIPVWILIPQLINQYKLPLYDADGNKLAYNLEYTSYSSLERQRLDHYQTLANQGVLDGFRLDMMGEAIQLTRLKQFIGDKELSEKKTPGQPGALGYFFQQDDLKFMLNDLSNQENSGVHSLEKIERTVDLIYQILSDKHKLSENPSYLNRQWSETNLFSVLPVENQTISICSYWPDEVQINTQFDIYLEISLSLDSLGWMWLSRKDPIAFDVLLYIPDNNDLDLPSKFKIIGTSTRRLSVPVEPGQHRIITTYQLQSKKIGQFLINFDIFQEGRYLNTLVMEMQVRMEPANEESDSKTRIETAILRQSPGQRTVS